MERDLQIDMSNVSIGSIITDMERTGGLIILYLLSNAAAAAADAGAAVLVV